VPTPTTGKTYDVKITFYGWPDNDPPGAAIAYPTATQPQAGGTGTYADPITAAVSANNPLFPVHSIIYISELQKYVIVNDECATCSEGWIDIWVGGTASNSSAVLAQEDALTGNDTALHSVILNPDANLPVDTTPLLQVQASSLLPI